QAAGRSRGTRAPRRGGDCRCARLARLAENRGMLRRAGACRSAIETARPNRAVGGRADVSAERARPRPLLAPAAAVVGDARSRAGNRPEMTEIRRRPAGIDFAADLHPVLKRVYA